MTDFHGAVAQTAVSGELGTWPGMVAWLRIDQGIATVAGRVSTWDDVAIEALAIQEAVGELQFSGAIAQSAPAAAQDGLGGVPVEGEIAQEIAPTSQAAVGFLPVAAQTAPMATQAAEGQRFYVARPQTIRSLRFQGKRAERVYLGSTLIKQFAHGSLFDADGNQLSVELADGSPVTIEVFA